MQITVLGKASGLSTTLQVVPLEMSHNLMLWLRAQGVTIASSCDGEGVCKKCTIQNDWMTCRLTVEEFLQLRPDGIVEVSYL